MSSKSNMSVPDENSSFADIIKFKAHELREQIRDAGQACEKAFQDHVPPSVRLGIYLADVAVLGAVAATVAVVVGRESGSNPYMAGRGAAVIALPALGIIASDDFQTTLAETSREVKKFLIGKPRDSSSGPSAG